MGNGGEIYVFDMGQPVRIIDLAEKMIRLSGKEPGRDIVIEFTGLRPGEKKFEELLASQEGTMPTHHPRILIGRTRGGSYSTQSDTVLELISAAERSDTEACLRLMKQLVPEYTAQQ